MALIVLTLSSHFTLELSTSLDGTLNGGFTVIMPQRSGTDLSEGLEVSSLPMKVSFTWPFLPCFVSFYCSADL